MNINITPSKDKTILETFDSLLLLKSLGIAGKESTITGIAGEHLPAGYYNDAEAFGMALRGHYFNNVALIIESTKDMEKEDAKICLQEWEKQFRISRGIENNSKSLNDQDISMKAIRDIFDIRNIKKQGR
jgi:hypothetical protein